MSRRRHRALASRFHRRIFIVFTLIVASVAAVLRAQPPGEARPTTPEGRAAAVFANNCTHCHSGPDPYKGMGLTADRFYSNTVGRRSSEKPSHMLVAPSNPDSSYLVMKIRGAPGIVGRRMPIGAAPLADDEIA